MQKKTKALLGGAVLLAAVAAGALLLVKSPEPPTLNPNVKQFTLTAESQKITLADGVSFDALTYDGTVPGTQLRVTEGDTVRITLQNHLSEPTTIHWHGMPVPNSMDGIPGVTQNAVQPGQSLTYEFTATKPGTYWYHSHQNSAQQEDMGLYGALIVEPKNPTVHYDQDDTLVLDEWITGTNSSRSGMNGMDMSHMDMSNMSHDQMMKQMYDLFTVNGVSGSKIKPVEAQPGDRVKLRFINAGFQTHLLNLDNQVFQITDTDGQPISGPTDIQNQNVAIAPGERYDLSFVAGASFTIHDQNDSPAATGLVIPVVVGGKAPAPSETAANPRPTLNLAQYGAKVTPTPQTYNQEVKMVLNNVKDATGEEKYTINGQIFPNIPPIKVKKGDHVKVTMQNAGTSNHPMHLHGHFFQVLSKNGQPVQSNLMKDTLNVGPGETYEIAFEADNDGDWMFHCHDLHHAAAGMVTDVLYEGYQADFTPDPNAHNMPE